jgi:hypothetical protein
MSRRWLIGVSVVAHLAVGSAALISSVWRIERLDAMPAPERPHLLAQPPAKKRHDVPVRRLCYDCGRCGNGYHGHHCDGGSGSAYDDGLVTVPAPAPGPRLVAPAVLQSLRISASDPPRLSAATQQQMLRDGVDRIVVTVRVCVASDGAVASTRLMHYPRYDDHNAAIVRAVRAWRYRPFLVDGAAVPVCSLVTFVHKIP